MNISTGTLYFGKVDYINDQSMNTSADAERTFWHCQSRTSVKVCNRSGSLITTFRFMKNSWKHYFCIDESILRMGESVLADQSSLKNMANRQDFIIFFELREIAQFGTFKILKIVLKMFTILVKK